MPKLGDRKSTIISAKDHLWKFAGYDEISGVDGKTVIVPTYKVEKRETVNPR